MTIDDSKPNIGYVSHFECLRCGEKYSLDQLIEEQGTTMVSICYNNCLGPLDIKYHYDRIRDELDIDAIKKRPDTFWKFYELLPVNNIKLNFKQSFTPLVRSKCLGDRLGINLYFKLDSRLPSGSFKDRPVTLAINKALEYGYNEVFTASTGNLAISTAHFARENNIKSRVYVPETLNENRRKLIRDELIDPENDLILYPGSFDDANVKAFQDARAENEKTIKTLRRRLIFVPNNTFRPYYKEGSKTSGFEIVTQLEQDEILKGDTVHLIYPIGSGALICSAYKGIKELNKLGFIDYDVSFHGVQAEECAPVVDAYLSDEEDKEIIPVKAGDQLVREIAIGNPGSGYQTLDVFRETNGAATKVSEKEIVDAFFDLYEQENIYPQFVGALTLAGTYKLIQEGKIPPGVTVVVNITGKGEGRIEDDLKIVSEKYGRTNLKRIINFRL